MSRSSLRVLVISDSGRRPAGDFFYEGTGKGFPGISCLAPFPRFPPFPLDFSSTQMLNALYSVNRNCFDIIVLREILMGDADTTVKISLL
jgi:hypothetical protein